MNPTQRGAAVRQVADHEGVRSHRVKIVDIEERQVGPTVKYIITGREGLHRLVLGCEGGSQ